MKNKVILISLSILFLVYIEVKTQELDNGSKKDITSEMGKALHIRDMGEKINSNSKLPKLTVFKEDGHPCSYRYLVTEEGKPFFWLGDTAWQLFWWTDKSSAEDYLKKRHDLGYNIIQATLLSFKTSVDDLPVCGILPFQNSDPSKPNIELNKPNYWDHVDFVISTAEKYEIYIAVLLTWGKYVHGPYKHEKNYDPNKYVIFNSENAYIYGKWVGERYKDRTNIIWVLGGDIAPEGEHRDKLDVWKAMTEGLAQGLGNLDKRPDWSDKEESIWKKFLFTFHPQHHHSSSKYFNGMPWIQFHMSQSGHKERNLSTIWELVEDDYKHESVLPTLNSEPNYEYHPVGWQQDNGWFDDYDIRKSAYWSVFAGGFGYTYGTWSDWQIQRPDVADNLPGLAQVQHLKYLIESRPFLTRIPDQSILITGQGKNNAEHIQACRDINGDYAFVYFPVNNQTVEIDLSKMSGENILAWWFHPQNGFVCSQKGYAISAPFEEIETKDKHKFTSPKNLGPDWVLVLDNASKDFLVPGKESRIK